MAFQCGPITITGTFDGLSFYHSIFGWLVRQKGGPTSKQFRESPTYARAREINLGFKNCSKTASIIRKIVITYTGASERTLYHKLMRVLTELANLDRGVNGGKRNLLTELSAAPARAMLDDIVLEDGQQLSIVLIAAGILDPTTNSPPDKKCNNTISLLRSGVPNHRRKFIRGSFDDVSTLRLKPLQLDLCHKLKRPACSRAG